MTLLVTNPTTLLPKGAVVLCAGRTDDGQRFVCHGWTQGDQTYVALTQDGVPMRIPKFAPHLVATTLDVVQSAFRDALRDAGVTIEEP